jgi:lysophospholipase L1-like esterase
MNGEMKNWVFLGDSLTEGVGSGRVSFVSELTRCLRENPFSGYGPNVHEVRLRRVEPDGFNRFIRFNLAGHWDASPRNEAPQLWLWNLACEGRTVDTDAAWLPLIENLRPEMIFVFRGSLESILRPAAVKHGRWPIWVPKSWRGYAAMDPRCYYSSTWWRRLKQAGLDAVRQRIRHSLLRRESGQSLIDQNTFIAVYLDLVNQLRKISKQVFILGLLPIDGKHFPGSSERFCQVNSALRQIAQQSDVAFVDWGVTLAVGKVDVLFYRDGFHPNQPGASALAKILREELPISDE